MTQKTKNPAALARADRARSDCLEAVTAENTTNPSAFQLLGNVAEGVVTDLSARRVTYLASRYRLAPAMARAVERHLFGEARR